MSKNHIQLELERNPLEVLLRYVEGKLSAPEKQTVETLVADSPVYADALEGLQTMENPALARSMANDLRYRTRNLLRRKSKPRVAQFNLTQYLTAAVAVIVVLFAAASVVYFYSRNDTQPATTTASAETAPAPQSEQSAPVAGAGEEDKRLRPFRRTAPVEYDGPSLTESIISDASPANQPAERRSLLDDVAPERPTRPSSGANAGSAKPVPQNEKPARQAAPVKATPETVYVALQNEPTLSEERRAEYADAKTADDRAEAEAEEEAKDEIVAAAEDVAAETEIAPEVSVPAQATREQEKVASRAKESAAKTQKEALMDPAKAYQERQYKKVSLMKQGEMLFNTARYEEAESVFLELYTLDQLDPKTQYYLGSTYYFIGRPAEATIYLEQVIRVSSDFLEEAQWRLVDAYLAVNKIDEAKDLLKKISKLNGKYSDRAQAKLKEIK